jgi:hypothetical protein
MIVLSATDYCSCPNPQKKAFRRRLASLIPDPHRYEYTCTVDIVQVAHLLHTLIHYVCLKYCKVFVRIKRNYY